MTHDQVPDDEQDVDSRLRSWAGSVRAQSTSAMPTLPARASAGSTTGRRWAVALVAAAVAVAVALPFALSRPGPSAAAPDGGSAASTVPAGDSPPPQVVAAVELVIAPNYPGTAPLAVHYEHSVLDEAPNQEELSRFLQTAPSDTPSAAAGSGDLGPVATAMSSGKSAGGAGWFAVATGHFVAATAKGAPGADPPQGSRIWVSVTDAGEVIGWGVDNVTPLDLGFSGAWVTMRPGTVSASATPSTTHVPAAPSTALDTGQKSYSPTGSVDPGGPAAPPQAAGTKAVGLHGLTVDVPADWPIDALLCGPTQDTVLLAPIRTTCGSTKPQTVTSVDFRAMTDPSQVVKELQGWKGAVWTVRQHTISGHPATVIEGSVAEGLNQEQLLAVRVVDVADLHTGFEVMSPDPALADRIVASTRIEAVDPASGCATAAALLPELPTGQSPQLSGADRAIFPGSPTRIVVCDYDLGQLEYGMAATGTKLAELQGLLTSAPSGTFRLATADLPVAACGRPLPSGVPTPPTTNYDTEILQLTATYADGATVTALGRIQTCGDLGFANGSHTVQPTFQLASWLAEQGLVFSFPGHLPGGPQR